MAPNKKSLSSYAWILWTMIFVLIATSLLVLILWKPLVGCLTVLLLLLTVFVGSFMKAYTEHHNNSQPNNDNGFQIEHTLTKDELKRSQLLLRYATAILAFLSLLTTAEGLQSFVFDSDKGWMAYIGSFAVQGILVVFSLLLCRFFVLVNQLKWPGYIKTLANGVLVVFFCVALIVSSTFSFSYIANNAYYGNWLADSEMIIQTHLMDSAYGLRRENEYRGNLILSEINETADDKLSEAIDSIDTLKTNDLTTALEDCLEVVTTSKFDGVEPTIDWHLVRASFSEYSKDIDVLADSYDHRTYLPGYRRNVKTYSTIMEDVKSWDVNVSSLEVSEHISSISKSITNLRSLREDIDSWYTHSLKNDIANYRTDYKNACTNLINYLTNLKANLEHILNLTEQLASIEKNSVSADLNAILSDVYLLGVDDKVSATDISGKLTDLALQASADENFTSQNIASIMELRDLLVSYSDYKELEAEIAEFINSNLQNNYQVIRDTDEGKEEDPTDATLPPANDPTEHVDVIDESEWRKTRSNDFNEFYKLVKSLPIVDENQTSYDETEVILDASQIHRDLLGETTEFEKAFNFFKYRFPFMAFFSAFIAVFFDLGSFLTGCFLYVTEFFVTTKKDKQQPEEDKPD